MLRTRNGIQLFVILLCAATFGCGYTTSPDELIRGTREVAGITLTARLGYQGDDGFWVSVEFHNSGTVSRTFKLQNCIGALLYSVHPAADVAPAWGRTEDAICPGTDPAPIILAPGESRYSTYGASYSYPESRPRPGKYYAAVHVGLDIPDLVVILAVINTPVVVD